MLGLKLIHDSKRGPGRCKDIIGDGIEYAIERIHL